MLALLLLFFKLPETPTLIQCTSCTTADPYFPLVGAAYFSTLAALLLLFPAFPSRHLARAGLLFALLLAVLLTYLNYPVWCPTCLMCHGCHVALWLFAKPVLDCPVISMRERLFLTLFAPVAVVALFSCLNLTMMVYDIQMKPHLVPLKRGDVIPEFKERFGDFPISMINFVSPDCHYCKEQLPLLNTIARNAHCVTVTPELTTDLKEDFSHIQWIEDSKRELGALFKVSGYPTLYVVDGQGEILEVIRGVSAQFERDLVAWIGE